jgi:hypothetical protein
MAKKVTVADVMASRLSELADSIMSEEGTWKPEWIASVPVRHRNYVSDKEYRGGTNLMQLTMSELLCPEILGRKRSGYCITLKAAFGLGWKLKPEFIGLSERKEAIRGLLRTEKDPVERRRLESELRMLTAARMPIEFSKPWFPDRGKESEGSDEDESPDGKKKDERVAFVERYYVVYPIECFDDCGHTIAGREPAKPEAFESGEADGRAVRAISRLIGWCEANGVSVKEGKECRYIPESDSIELPKRETFRSYPMMASALARECGRATGSPKRLARKCFGNEPKEGLIGESCALFHSLREGYADDGTIRNCFAYLKESLNRAKASGSGQIMVSALNLGLKSMLLIEGTPA